MGVLVFIYVSIYHAILKSQEEKRNEQLREL